MAAGTCDCMRFARWCALRREHRVYRNPAHSHRSMRATAVLRPVDRLHCIHRVHSEYTATSTAAQLAAATPRRLASPSA
eukprot:3373400-Prymnesium_polylepis.1